MELYFKCSKCDCVFYNKSRKYVKDDEIQKMENIKYKICDDCNNYILWEHQKYF